MSVFSKFINDRGVIGEAGQFVPWKRKDEGGGGGGGSITVDTAMSPTSTNPVQNKAVYAALAYAAEIVDGKEDKALHETISEAAAEITPEANTIYNCGELTSLTISNPPATGKYSVIFFSGATATTTVGIENFVAEANKRYKITVEDNYATYDSWPYTPTP
jgi:hypothetical protein